MNQKNPYWYALIKLFKKVETKYRITTGLTIPFLFGAYQLLERPFENIKQLIQSIIDSEIDKYPIIQRCHVIGKHVVMVQERAYCNKNFIKFPRIESAIVDNSLLISTNSPNLGKTYERICYNLTAEYVGPIERGEFSWSNGNNRWRKFDHREIELIKGLK
jgi:hypothetical protein